MHKRRDSLKKPPKRDIKRKLPQHKRKFSSSVSQEPSVKLPSARTYTRLVVLDAFSILFRNHFAMQRNPLRRADDGRVVSGLSGFAGTVMKVAKDIKPTHIAVCVDTPASIGFRRKLLKQYKSDRGGRDDDLVWQIQQLPYVIQSLGIPSILVPGFEADDVIASLAHRVQLDKTAYGQLYKDKNTFFDQGYEMFSQFYDGGDVYSSQQSSSLSAAEPASHHASTANKKSNKKGKNMSTASSSSYRHDLFPSPDDITHMSPTDLAEIQARRDMYISQIIDMAHTETSLSKANPIIEQTNEKTEKLNLVYKLLGRLSEFSHNNNNNNTITYKPYTKTRTMNINNMLSIMDVLGDAASMQQAQTTLGHSTHGQHTSTLLKNMLYNTSSSSQQNNNHGTPLHLVDSKTRRSVSHFLQPSSQSSSSSSFSAKLSPLPPDLNLYHNVSSPSPLSPIATHHASHVNSLIQSIRQITDDTPLYNVNMMQELSQFKQTPSSSSADTDQSYNQDNDQKILARYNTSDTTTTTQPIRYGPPVKQIIEESNVLTLHQKGYITDTVLSSYYTYRSQYPYTYQKQARGKIAFVDSDPERVGIGTDITLRLLLATVDLIQETSYFALKYDNKLDTEENKCTKIYSSLFSDVGSSSSATAATLATKSTPVKRTRKKAVVSNDDTIDSESKDKEMTSHTRFEHNKEDLDKTYVCPPRKQQSQRQQTQPHDITTTDTTTISTTTDGDTDFDLDDFVQYNYQLKTEQQNKMKIQDNDSIDDHKVIIKPKTTTRKRKTTKQQQQQVEGDGDETATSITALNTSTDDGIIDQRMKEHIMAAQHMMSWSLHTKHSDNSTNHSDKTTDDDDDSNYYKDILKENDDKLIPNTPLTLNTTQDGTTTDLGLQTATLKRGRKKAAASKSTFDDAILSDSVESPVKTTKTTRKSKSSPNPLDIVEKATKTVTQRKRRKQKDSKAMDDVLTDTFFNTLSAQFDQYKDTVDDAYMHTINQQENGSDSDDDDDDINNNNDNKHDDSNNMSDNDHNNDNKHDNDDISPEPSSMISEPKKRGRKKKVTNIENINHDNMLLNASNISADILEDTLLTALESSFAHIDPDTLETKQQQQQHQDDDGDHNDNTDNTGKEKKKRVTKNSKTASSSVNTNIHYDHDTISLDDAHTLQQEYDHRATINAMSYQQPSKVSSSQHNQQQQQPSTTHLSYDQRIEALIRSNPNIREQTITTFKDDRTWWGPTHHKALFSLLSPRRKQILRSMTLLGDANNPLQADTSFYDDYIDSEEIDFTDIEHHFELKKMDLFEHDTSIINTTNDDHYDQDGNKLSDIQQLQQQDQDNKKRPHSQTTMSTATKNKQSQQRKSKNNNQQDVSIHEDSTESSSELSSSETELSSSESTSESSSSLPSPLHSFTTYYIPFPTDNGGIYTPYNTTIDSHTYYDNLYYLNQIYNQDIGTTHQINNNTRIININNYTSHVNNLNDSLSNITPLPVTMHRYTHSTSPHLPLAYPVTLEDEHGLVYDLSRRYPKYDAHGNIYTRSKVKYHQLYDITHDNSQLVPIYKQERYPRIYPSMSLPPQLLPIKLNNNITLSTIYNRHIIEDLSQRDIVRFGIYSLSPYSNADTNSIYYNDYMPRLNTTIHRDDPNDQQFSLFSPSPYSMYNLPNITTYDREKDKENDMFDKHSPHCDIDQSTNSSTPTKYSPRSTSVYGNNDSIEPDNSVSQYDLPLLPAAWYSSSQYNMNLSSYQGPEQGWWKAGNVNTALGGVEKGSTSTNWALVSSHKKKLEQERSKTNTMLMSGGPRGLHNTNSIIHGGESDIESDTMTSTTPDKIQQISYHKQHTNLLSPEESADLLDFVDIPPSNNSSTNTSSSTASKRLYGTPRSGYTSTPRPKYIAPPEALPSLSFEIDDLGFDFDPGDSATTAAANAANKDLKTHTKIVQSHTHHENDNDDDHNTTTIQKPSTYTTRGGFGAHHLSPAPSSSSSLSSTPPPYAHNNLAESLGQSLDRAMLPQGQAPQHHSASPSASPTTKKRSKKSSSSTPDFIEPSSPYTGNSDLLINDPRSLNSSAVSSSSSSSHHSDAHLFDQHADDMASLAATGHHSNTNNYSHPHQYYGKIDQDNYNGTITSLTSSSPFYSNNNNNNNNSSSDDNNTINNSSGNNISEPQQKHTKLEDHEINALFLKSMKKTYTSGYDVHVMDHNKTNIIPITSPPEVGKNSHHKVSDTQHTNLKDDVLVYHDDIPSSNTIIPHDVYDNIVKSSLPSDVTDPISLDLIQSVTTSKINAWLPLIDHVYVVSADKDLEQVISPHVTMLKQTGSPGVLSAYRKFDNFKKKKAKQDELAKKNQYNMIHSDSLVDYKFTPVSVFSSRSSSSYATEQAVDLLSDTAHDGTFSSLPRDASSWTGSNRDPFQTTGPVFKLSKYLQHQANHNHDDSSNTDDNATNNDNTGSVSYINPNPEFYDGDDPQNGIAFEHLDYNKVVSKNKFCPTQIPHMQALSGDSSDSVPGIKGIGSILAQRLISSYGDINNIIQIASLYMGYDSIHTKLIIDRCFSRREQAKYNSDDDENSSGGLTFYDPDIPSENVLFLPEQVRSYCPTTTSSSLSHDNNPTNAIDLSQDKQYQQISIEQAQLQASKRRQSALALGWPLNEKLTSRLLNNIDILTISLGLVSMRKDIPVVHPKHTLYTGTDMTNMVKILSQYDMYAISNKTQEMADINNKTILQAAYHGEYGPLTIDAGLYLHQTRKQLGLKKSIAAMTPDPIPGFMSYQFNLPLVTPANMNSDSPLTHQYDHLASQTKTNDNNISDTARARALSKKIDVYDNSLWADEDNGAPKPLSDDTSLYDNNNNHSGDPSSSSSSSSSQYTPLSLLSQHLDPLQGALLSSAYNTKDISSSIYSLRDNIIDTIQISQQAYYRPRYPTYAMGRPFGQQHSLSGPLTHRTSFNPWSYLPHTVISSHSVNTSNTSLSLGKRGKNGGTSNDPHALKPDDPDYLPPGQKRTFIPHSLHHHFTFNLDDDIASNTPYLDHMSEQYNHYMISSSSQDSNNIHDNHSSLIESISYTSPEKLFTQSTTRKPRTGINTSSRAANAGTQQQRKVNNTQSSTSPTTTTTLVHRRENTNASSGKMTKRATLQQQQQQLSYDKDGNDLHSLHNNNDQYNIYNHESDADNNNHNNTTELLSKTMNIDYITHEEFNDIISTQQQHEQQQSLSSGTNKQKSKKGTGSGSTPTSTPNRSLHTTGSHNIRSSIIYPTSQSTKRNHDIISSSSSSPTLTKPSFLLSSVSPSLSSFLPNLAPSSYLSHCITSQTSLRTPLNIFHGSDHTAIYPTTTHNSKRHFASKRASKTTTQATIDEPSSTNNTTTTATTVDPGIAFTLTSTDTTTPRKPHGSYIAQNPPSIPTEPNTDPISHPDSRLELNKTLTGILVNSPCPQSLAELPVSTIIHSVLSSTSSGLTQNNVDDIEQRVKQIQSATPHSGQVIVQGLFKTIILGKPSPPKQHQ